MYICEQCGGLAPVGVKQHKLVVQTVTVQFPFRAKANKVKGLPPKKWKDDPGGTGTQIAKELSVCPACFGSKAN